LFDYISFFKTTTDISDLQEEPISMQNLNKESILEEYINKILDIKYTYIVELT